MPSHPVAAQRPRRSASSAASSPSTSTLASSPSSAPLDVVAQKAVDELQQRLNRIARQIPCRYFLRQGSCLNGDACTFSHDRSTMPYCKRFIDTGHCPLEHQCRFQHPPRHETVSAKQLRARQAEYDAAQKRLDAEYGAIKSQLAAAKRKAAQPTIKSFHINIRKKWKAGVWHTSETKLARLPLRALQLACHSLVPIGAGRALLVPGTIHRQPSSVKAYSDTLLELDLDHRSWSVRYEGDQVRNGAVSWREHSFRSTPCHTALHDDVKQCVYVLTAYPDFLLRFDLSRNAWDVLTTIDSEGLGHSTLASPQSGVLLRRPQPLDWTFAGEEIQMHGTDQQGSDYSYIVMYRPTQVSFQDDLVDEPSEDEQRRLAQRGSCLWALSLTSFRWFELPNCGDGTVPCDRYLSSLLLRKHGLRELPRLVLFGGWTSHVGQSHNAVFEYDVENYCWTTLAAETASLLQTKKDADKVIYAPHGRCLHSAVLIEDGKRMLISGGTDGTHAFGDMWTFSFDSFKWARMMHVLQVPRLGHAALVLPEDQAGRTRLLLHGGIARMDDDARWLLGEQHQAHDHEMDSDDDEQEEWESFASEERSPDGLEPQQLAGPVAPDAPRPLAADAFEQLTSPNPCIAQFERLSAYARRGECLNFADVDVSFAGG